MSKLFEEIVSGRNVRDAVYEASLTFIPGSLADGVFKTMKAAKDYYSKLIVNEFQLYSTVYHQVLKLEQIDLTVDQKDYSIEFNCLKKFNSVPFSHLEFVQFEFNLSPELSNLPQMAQFNPNHDLFKNVHQFACPMGDGRFYSIDFKPSYNQVGFVLQSTLIRTDFDNNLIYGSPDSAAHKVGSVPSQSLDQLNQVDQINQFNSTDGFDISSYYSILTNSLVNGN